MAFGCGGGRAVMVRLVAVVGLGVLVVVAVVVERSFK
jgi:hypothetical protein